MTCILLEENREIESSKIAAEENRRDHIESR